MAKFEIYPDSKKEYRWRFKADNGKTMADSGEGYTYKSSCQAAIDTIKAQVPTAKVEDLT